MIGRSLSICLLAALVAFCGSAVQAGESKKAAPAEDKDGKKEESKHAFVGVTNCKMCHQDPETGDQFGHWKKSEHAEALKTLSGKEAKEIGTKMGIANPAKDAKCLKCHVTAFEAPKDMKAKTWKEADAVGCESCHGPGKDYAKEDIMKSREASMEKGLVLPTEKVCVKCHNKESPTFKEFNFEKMVKKIEHPNPKAKK
jgi:hypothetical protein